MGLFTTSKPTTAPPAKLSPDGTPIAPGRSERSRCWEARDIYFSCLDKQSIIDSIKESKKAGEFCGKEGVEFENNCASSWVVYFKQRRVVEEKKRLTLEGLRKEGAEEMPGVIGPNPNAKA